MTRILQVKNVNHAFQEAWWWMKTAGVLESSRNGPVLVAPGPVVTEYSQPTQRVLFNPVRDANAVFHLMESIWMLAGENDVRWLLPYSKNIGTYAEDNHEIHGAYGHRWRRHFGFDQMERIVKILRRDPHSRQAVLQMWSPSDDLIGDWKDRPCNTACYFDCRGGVLNMTVTCRSNDMLWGAYGANAVHFSVLQEVIAAGVGVPVGVYRQFSNNFHAYTSNEQVSFFLENPPLDACDAYEHGTKVINLVQPWEEYTDFIADCEAFVHGSHKFRTQFMQLVAAPLSAAYIARKAGLAWRLDGILDCDWKLAFHQWTERRMEK